MNEAGARTGVYVGIIYHTDTNFDSVKPGNSLNYPQKLWNAARVA